MAAKPQHAEPPPAAAAAAAEAPAKPAANAMGGLLPLIVVIVLAPTLSWSVGQFVLLPQLKKQLAVAAESGHGEGGGESAPAASEKKGEGGKEAKGKKGESSGPATNYEFENIVVNLAGTMGTRYLKTSFMVSGNDASLRSQFENNRAKLVDVTLNVLSSLSL